MGQYYCPIILSDDGQIVAHLNSHEYSAGLKLMEHSWLGNDFVAVVEALLASDGARRLVWAGDYADPEPGTEDNLSCMAQDNPVRFDCPALNSAPYMEPVTPNAELPVKVTTESHPFIVNVDRQEYVDKAEVPAVKPYWDPARAWTIHPLPILTAEGNGRGGGDYRGHWPHVGRWARERIYVGATVPDGFAKLDVSGLTE